MNTSEAPNGKAIITTVYQGREDLFYTDYSGGELETIPFLLVNDAPLFTGAVAQQFRPGYEPADQDGLRLTLIWGISTWGLDEYFMVHNQDTPGSDFFIEKYRRSRWGVEELLWHGEVMPGFAVWLYSLGISLNQEFVVQANLVRDVGSNIDAAGGAWKMSSEDDWSNDSTD